MKTDPRTLQLFLAVCRAGSISGAARAQNLAQPSVSVALSRLEESLGVRLFNRHRSGIQLTPAGLALERRALAMESLLETARHEVHLVSAQISGPLIIGGTPGALATVMPKIVELLRREHPQFEVRILERSDEALPELLRINRIDLAVATTGIDERPADIKELPILTDPFALIVGRANDHLPDEISLPDLTSARWVLPEAAGAFRRQIDALFIGARTATPSNIIRCDSLLTTIAIVRKTDYLTILPREVAAAELSTRILRALRIKGTLFQRQVGVLWLADRDMPPFGQAFLDHARAIANP